MTTIDKRTSLFVALATLSLLGSASAQRPGVTHYGSGCPGTSFSVPIVDVLGIPWPGVGLRLDMEGFPGPGTHFLMLHAGPTRPTPFALAPFGFAHCFANVDPLQAIALPFQTGIDGRAMLPGALPGTPGEAYYFQTIFADVIGGLSFSDGLELVLQTPPPLNTAVSLEPHTGSEGTRVAIAGLYDVQNYRAQDVFLVGRHPRGMFGRAGGIEELGASYLVGSIAHMGRFAAEQPLTALFGRGEWVGQPGANPHDHMWVHRHRPGQDPAIDTPFDFQPDGQLDIPCGSPLPPYTQGLFTFDPATNELCFKYPVDSSGNATFIPAGESLELVLEFTLTGGDVLTVTFPKSLPLSSSIPWTVYGPILALSIKNAIQSTFGITLDVTSDASGFCLENPGDPIASYAAASFVKMHFDPMGTYVTTTYDFGNAVPGSVGSDDYVGPEPTHPSPAFDTFVRNTIINPHPIFTAVGYDTLGWCDRIFHESLMGYGPGVVRGAILEIRMRGAGCQTYTDSLNLGWTGQSTGARWEWGESVLQLADLGYSWTPGQNATICFDLNAMPDHTATGDIYVNLLCAMADGELEFLAQDDTAFDYLKLTVVKKL